MRVGIGDFVDADPMNSMLFALGGPLVTKQTPVAAAPRRGQGDFVGGKFAVPQNPVTDGLGTLVNSGPLYPIPQNSVLSYYQSGGSSFKNGLAGLGCGCEGKCGMGDITLGSYDLTTAFSSAWSDVQAAISAGSLTPITTNDWVTIGGTAVAAYVLFSMFGKKGRR